MNRIRLHKDIKPLSEFRANVAHCINQVNKTSRPLLITNHGRSAAVLMDVAEYEAMVEKFELLQDVKTAEAEIAEGKVLTHSEAKKKFLGKLKK